MAVKIRFSAIVCLIATVLSLASCSVGNDNYQNIDSSKTYDTTDPIDAYNYTLYVNKEIDLTLNVLSTHIAVGEKIFQGEYNTDDEIKNLERDIDLVAEAVESVESFYPPDEYEDDREAILDKLVNAQGSLQEYKDTLEENDTDSLRACIDLMEGDYISLTSSFNLQWE